MSKKSTLKDIIRDFENSPEIKKLPLQAREIIKSNLESITTVRFPIITFQENNWILATTPLIDLCAQGKTEEEAIENLKAMIDDYMQDPDTQKPEIKTIINMQISLRNVPMKLPLKNLEQGENHARQVTSTA